jgi:MoCo/4Fe-4S cofactor protein with predicted Tat translocation signal
MNRREQRLDLTSLGRQLTSSQEKGYWRCLDELAGTEEFEEMLHREFPAHISEWSDPIGRRRFLKLMGASLALAGLSACVKPPQGKIFPYSQPPSEILIPGKPLFFATAMTIAGRAIGLLVESHMGRPTKVEGNPLHPASLGSTDPYAQASVLSLYDPDRSQTTTSSGEIKSWGVFVSDLNRALAPEQERQGAGLRILTETVTSPTLADQIQRLLTKYPQAKWHQYDPALSGTVGSGSRMAFGEYVETIYRLDGADVILSLDSDFLCSGPAGLRYAREFSSRRRILNAQDRMNRLYAVESMPSGTGARADHRLPLRQGEIQTFARSLAARLGIGSPATPATPATTAYDEWISALAEELQQHRGSSLVIAGDYQPAFVHALAHSMNQSLGNVGKTVIYTDPVEANPIDQTESLRDLVRDIDAGLVSILLILGGNPVYTAPADLRFGERLSKVGFRIHLSLYQDETSELCQWHIPENHYLESWSDARAYDGTVTIIQPLIAPLYNTLSAHEMLAIFTGDPQQSDYEIVRNYWQTRYGQSDFERFWSSSLNDGLVPNTASSPKTVSLKTDWLNLKDSGQVNGVDGGNKGTPERDLEIIFRLDPSVLDGRFSNNAWLQELPKPLTQLTWDNAAIISPATAERLGLSYTIGWRGGEHGEALADQVELIYQGRSVRAPVWILPGHADDSVTVHLGYGRWKAGRAGNGAGFNAYAIRSSDRLWQGAGLEINKTGEIYPLACTQAHYLLEGTELVRSTTLEQYRKEPDYLKEEEARQRRSLSLYPGFTYPGYAWGMVIDLNACVGCNACVVACQAENNVPVVGKEEVMRGREMHWLRIDRYYKGNPGYPEFYFEPLLCQQCEKAPCEVVCPVAATVHSAEGLNDMVYNRCVGTRYCSNNCPYKVRRFNFFQYADYETPSLKLLYNPDVTVRSRGVMEKCTYCVQRITAARIESQQENRRIRDGEIVTACQGACPTEAIVFGDINDPNSRVSKLKASSRNYSLLGELNTQPRTSYLAAVQNKNSLLKGSL